MDKDIKLKVSKLGTKIARIEIGPFSKIPSIEEYKSYIKELLGIDNDGNLRNEGRSQDIAEALLLDQELRDMNYEQVVFSTPDGDIVVNAENFEQVFESLESNGTIKTKRPATHKKDYNGIGGEAIQDAIDEMFDRC